MSEPVLYVALFVTGIVAGTLNVIAGGGSFLTLPVLIFAGLPATVANGTNRVGILFQNASAVQGFHRHQLLDGARATAAAVPAVAGAALGAAAAVWIGDAAFQRILSLLMVAVTLLTLLSPRGGATAAGREPVPPTSPWLVLGFFLVGVYGGFVQAGVGFFILAVTTLAGLDLVRGNALKVLCVLAFTVMSLAIFWWQGKVEWAPGLALAAGTVLGGQLGVRLTTLKGHRWVRSVVTVTVILFAIRLWLQ